MEEDIKNVEHAIKNFNGRAIDCISIGKLLKAYKELKEENKELKENNQILQKQLNGAFDRGFIPVSKVKEKIEELKTEFHKLDEQIDIRKESRDMQDYWEDKEKISTMQTISWCQGKLEELLGEE